MKRTLQKTNLQKSRIRWAIGHVTEGYPEPGIHFVSVTIIDEVLEAHKIAITPGRLVRLLEDMVDKGELELFVTDEDVLFALLPAARAARTQPAEALRYE